MCVSHWPLQNQTRVCHAETMIKNVFWGIAIRPSGLASSLGAKTHEMSPEDMRTKLERRMLEILRKRKKPGASC